MMRLSVSLLLVLALVLGGLAQADGDSDEGDGTLIILDEVPPDWCPGCEFIGPGKETNAKPISAARDASRPFVVKIHADWCMTCLMLDVTWAELGKRLGLHARLVVLDVTNPETRKVARAEAERLGMLPFFERYRSRTGAVGVLHGVSRQTVTVLLGELDAGRYEAAVKEAATKEAS